MPVVGEIARGRDVGMPAHGAHKLIWHACVICGNARWVALVNGVPLRDTCRPCASSAANKARAIRPDADGMRSCTICGQRNQAAAFLKRKDGSVRSSCRDCATKRSQAWRAANRERDRDNRRAYERRRPEVGWASAIKSRYGITARDFNSMQTAQGGACAICRQPPKRGRLHIDHCHETGKVRGLLCGPCNRMLGLAADRPAILDAGAAYLRAPPAFAEHEGDRLLAHLREGAVA